MKAVAFLHKKNGFFWRIRKTDPDQIEIAPDLFLINPRFYRNIVPIETNWSVSIFGGDKDGSLLVQSAVLVVVGKSGPIPDEQVNSVKSLLNQIMLHVRNFSKNSNAPQERDIIVCSNWNMNTVAPNPFPEFGSGAATGIIPGYSVFQSATLDQVVQASKYSSGVLPPMPQLLMLDAIEAYCDNDFKVAILFAAMAIESAAETRLFETYEDAKEYPSKYPWMKFTQDKQGNNFDPVYKKLCHPKFELLVNERSLYLLRRSLLLDANDIFLEALKIYRTRNNIVHTGQVEGRNKNSVFIQSNKGSILVALKTVQSVLGWYGFDSDYGLGGFEKSFGPLRVKSI